MDSERFTEKAQAIISDCQDIALQYGHQQIDGEHLHLALLLQEDGLIGKLLNYMAMPVDEIVKDLELELGKLPKISGSGSTLYASRRFNQLLVDAKKIADDFKDEYVSVEHLYLSLLTEKNTSSSKIFRNYGITKETFLQALSKMRGNQRITSQNPEGNYDALNKYGRDLVELARKGRLDPVIGRDSEIRHVIQILSRRTRAL